MTRLDSQVGRVVNGDDIIPPSASLGMGSLREASRWGAVHEFIASSSESNLPTWSPPSKTKAHDAIRDHLASIDQTRRAQVEALASQLPPMRKDCQVAFAVPVAAAQEADSIGRLIGSYASLKDPLRVEVVLFLNASRADAAGIAETFEALSEATAAHPELAVHAFYRTLPSRTYLSGYARAFLTEVILTRILAAGPDADPLIASGDADMSEMSPAFVPYWRDLFASNPDVIAGSGRGYFDRESLMENPFLRFYDWLRSRVLEVVAPAQYRATEISERDAVPVSTVFPPMPGYNSIFRPDAYVRAGGYQTSMAQNDDAFLGAALARFGQGRIIIGGHDSYIRTSARREIAAFNANCQRLLTGESILSLWRNDGMGFKGDSDPVRTAKNLSYAEVRCADDRVKLFEHIANEHLGKITRRDPHLVPAIIERVFSGELQGVGSYRGGVNPIQLEDLQKLERFVERLIPG